MAKRVIITVEAETSMSVRELQKLQALVFGTLKESKRSKVRRATLKRDMPYGLRHDCLGLIKQVQVNVVR